jgi:hypothetical protein
MPAGTANLCTEQHLVSSVGDWPFPGVHQARQEAILSILQILSRILHSMETGLNSRKATGSLNMKQQCNALLENSEGVAV